MDVDEAGRDGQARRVDLFAAGRQIRADRADPAADDSDVGDERLAAGAIEHGPTTNHQVGLFGHDALPEMSGGPGARVRTVEPQVRNIKRLAAQG